MARLSGKGLFAIAVLLSLVTSVLVYQYLKGLAGRPAGPLITVVTAAVDIPPRTKITAKMVKESKVPPEYAQPGAIRELQAAVGAVTRERLAAGEQITAQRLVSEARMAGFSGAIPGDRRAVAIAVTEVTGVAGFIKAGDRVDVIATFDRNLAGDNVAKIVLQDIPVLAVGHDADTGLSGTGPAKERKDLPRTSTVTLALTPDEAAQVALAEDKGRLWLALRPLLPTGSTTVAAVAITPKDLIGFAAAPPAAEAGAVPAATSGPASSPKTREKPAGSIHRGIEVIKGTKIEAASVE